MARQEGFASCLALPLRTGRHPAAAVNLYATDPRVFADATHDVALLFALQGAVALDNAELYRQSVALVDQLHAALESRSVVERAKGLLMGRDGIPAPEALARLRRRSQHENRRLRDVAVELLDEHDATRSSSAPAPWVPLRDRRAGRRGRSA